jgi:hypothetical protein
MKDETTIGSIEKRLPLCSNEEEPSPFLLPCRRKIESRRDAMAKTVAFSGRPTLVVKPNQIDMVLRCDFVDVVDVFYIPAVSDYSREVLKTLWYTRDEIEQKKRDEFCCRIRIPGKGRRSPTQSSHNLQFLRHQRMIATVLQEQEKQRRMCHKIYGRLVDSSGNRRSSRIPDPKRLQDVYATDGKKRFVPESVSCSATQRPGTNGISTRLLQMRTTLQNSKSKKTPRSMNGGRWRIYIRGST